MDQIWARLTDYNKLEFSLCTNFQTAVETKTDLKRTERETDLLQSEKILRIHGATPPFSRTPLCVVLVFYHDSAC